MHQFPCTMMNSGDDDIMDSIARTLNEKKPTGGAGVRRRSSTLETLASSGISIDTIDGVDATADDGFTSPSKEYDMYGTVLGTGTYGSVRECLHRPTNRILAVKSIDKARVESSDIYSIQREVDILRSIDHHPSIVKLVYTFEDDECVHIITERYTGGELHKKIVDNTTDYGCLPEHSAAKIIKVSSRQLPTSTLWI